jgi:hypothetical protein
MNHALCKPLYYITAYFPAEDGGCYQAEDAVTYQSSFPGYLLLSTTTTTKMSDRLICQYDLRLPVAVRREKNTNIPSGMNGILIDTFYAAQYLFVKVKK